MNGTNAERRERNRLPVRPLEPTGFSTPAPCRLVDISQSGCLVESSEPLGEVASAVRLSLPLPNGAARNPVRARIIWRTEQDEGEEHAAWLYGLRFEEADAASQDALRRYLDFLRRDWHITGLDEAWRRLGARRERQSRPSAETDRDKPRQT